MGIFSCSISLKKGCRVEGRKRKAVKVKIGSQAKQERKEQKQGK